MHLDTYQLAAYLDGALDAATRAATRAHILTCPACAARLDRLRDDARRITSVSASSPTPDVRAAVRARLRRASPFTWLARGGAFAGALAALLLFAVLIGISSGGTLGRTPDRLLVVDRNNGRLLAFDASNGAVLNDVLVGDTPAKIRYDERRDRLYILVKQAILAVDARTLTVVARWEAPQPFDLTSGMALDVRRGRLYAAQPAAASVVVLDISTFMPIDSFGVGNNPSALVLAPDGSRLFALDGDGMLWTIDPMSGTKSAQSLSGGERWPLAWLALSSDGQTVYVLHADGDLQNSTPKLWRIDSRSGGISGPIALPTGEAPWDLLSLDDGHLAIPRGDGTKGGITIVETDSFRVTSRINPDSDEHHAVAGPGGSMFTLNFGHGTVTRYDLSQAQPITWQVVVPGAQPPQPYDGVFVPGGWRWPW
jgi:DNA-binding beta-propeller fold protein YncE